MLLYVYRHHELLVNIKSAFIFLIHVPGLTHQWHSSKEQMFVFIMFHQNLIAFPFHWHHLWFIRWCFVNWPQTSVCNGHFFSLIKSWWIKSNPAWLFVVLFCSVSVLNTCHIIKLNELFHTIFYFLLQNELKSKLLSKIDLYAAEFQIWVILFTFF